MLELVGGVQEEPCGTVEASGSPPSRASRLYPPCFLLSLVKMESMFSASRRGLHVGRNLPEPAPPQHLDLDSLLVSPSLSRGLLEEQGAVLMLVSEKTAAGEEEEEEDESVRLWMMLLIVSFKSRRRLMEEGGLRRWRGTCCSLNVSPGGRKSKRILSVHP